MILGSAKKNERAVFDVIVVGRLSVFGFHFLCFMYAFICAHDHFPCLITVVVLTMEFKRSGIFFVSYA